MVPEKETRKVYSELLWQTLKEKAEADWQEKYRFYGDGTDSVDVTTKFSQAFCSDIKSFLTARKLKYRVPHHLTIDKYFKQDGFPENVQSATLDVLSVYAGYTGWGDFMKRNKLPAEEEEVSIGLATLPEAAAGKRYKLPLLGILAAVVLGVWFNFYSEKEETAPAASDTSRIEYAVENSMRAELSAYAAGPDTTAARLYLDSFFVKEGVAYKDISERIDKNVARQWVLNNESNPSSAELLSVRTDSVRGNLAYVSTKESWLIKWYDKTFGGYAYKYRVINEQSYILQQDDSGAWKVLANEYQAEVGKEPPGIFSRADFDDTMTKEDLVTVVRTAVQQGSLDFALWNLSVYSTRHKSTAENEISVLQGRFNGLLRKWNMEKISHSRFQAGKTELMREVLEILEKI